MAVVTATQVTIYTDISCSAGTTVMTNLIPIVQRRINEIVNNYFITEMQAYGSFTFGATAGTIVGGSDFTQYGFQAADEIYISNSYRNDGYLTVGSVTTVTITLASGSSVVSELSGKSILISVVYWPPELAYIAAQMIKYDYDDRAGKSIGVSSRSLGPFSESYANNADSTPYGYPSEIIDALMPYKYVRVS